MSELIDTTQMYLRTIVELHEEGVVALRARLAERLEHSGPTVSQTVSRMQRDGLLTLSSDRQLELTDTGRIEAVAVLRKHRIVECLLVDTLGVQLSLAHEEACRWEHVISAQVEQKILALLGFPEVSPYGCPIPGLAELGVSSPEVGQRHAGEPVSQVLGEVLARLADRQSASLVVSRLNEAIQDQATCRRLERFALLPGRCIEVRRQGQGTLWRSDTQPNSRFSVLPEPWSRHIWVRGLPD